MREYMQLSSKFRKWIDRSNGAEGLTYWCAGCEEAHSISLNLTGQDNGKGWTWNGDAINAVLSPSQLSSGRRFTDKGNADHAAWVAAGCFDPMPTFESYDRVCHTFIGCNGAQPGEVIFLGDCTHKLKGQIVTLPDLPEYMCDD